MCFIVVDSPSSSWTGALTNVYMTALDIILQWFILIALVLYLSIGHIESE